MTKFVWNNKFYEVAFLKLYCLIGKFILQILTSHDFFFLVTTQFLLTYTAQQGGVQEFKMLLKSGTKTILLSGASLGTCVVSQVGCWALETSSMKIRDIVVQPVYASASLRPLLQFPTQNPTRTLPL